MGRKFKKRLTTKKEKRKYMPCFIINELKSDETRLPVTAKKR